MEERISSLEKEFVLLKALVNKVLDQMTLLTERNTEQMSRHDEMVKKAVSMVDVKNNINTVQKKKNYKKEFIADVRSNPKYWAEFLESEDKIPTEEEAGKIYSQKKLDPKFVAKVCDQFDPKKKKK